MPMMTEDMPMREPPASAPESGSERPSVFLPKSALMGKQVKPGDTLTLTVQDVDPETGDIEATCDYGESESGEDEGYEREFDRAMPEEEMED